MDFKKFGKVILALGIIVAIVGIVQLSANQPKRFNRSESKQTVFGGRNDLGNMLDVNMTNMSREGKRKKATNVIVIGCIVAFVGLGMSASSTKKSPEVSEFESEETMFCPNCGAKLENNVKFCPECGNEI
ncbi:MAG: zinc ribbon domain-containing protein [Candidatus Delongbacteria bacterium]|nr:zinc ribbon domain-containing protein [Candidatus Delongbacteria bacterium]